VSDQYWFKVHKTNIFVKDKLKEKNSLQHLEFVSLFSHFEVKNDKTPTSRKAPKKFLSVIYFDYFR
jgi:hypothetical protein